METTQIAVRLHEMLNKIEFGQAQAELFSDDVTSTEPPHSQTGLPNVTGKMAAMAKGESFRALVKKWNHVSATEPVVYGPYFFTEIELNVTFKDGNTIHLKEMAKFEVKSGKIISEEYYY
jgi:hypothetical protein